MVELESGQLWRNSDFPLFGCLEIQAVEEDTVTVLETDTSVYADRELELDRDRLEQRIEADELYRDGEPNPKLAAQRGGGA